MISIGKPVVSEIFNGCTRCIRVLCLIVQTQLEFSIKSGQRWIRIFAIWNFISDFISYCCVAWCSVVLKMTLAIVECEGNCLIVSRTYAQIYPEKKSIQITVHWKLYCKFFELFFKCLMNVYIYIYDMSQNWLQAKNTSLYLPR